MKVVRTYTRPARIAFVVSRVATPRVLRRTFRLAGGRWGGAGDVILAVGSDTASDARHLTILRAADPDFVLALDPKLDDFDWSRAIESADIQPFYIARLRERMERNARFAPFFAEGPCEVGDPESDPVLDLDRPALTWQLAALAGLPASTTRRRRVKPLEATTDTAAPAAASLAHLQTFGSGVPWVFIADASDALAAIEFWTVRALGGRPTWAPVTALAEDVPPVEGPARIHVAQGYSEAADDAVARWRAAGYELAVPSPDWRELRSARSQYFATSLEAAPEHNEHLLFPTPAPPSLDDPIRTPLLGVSEHEILSPVPGEPDGVILARDEASRRLVLGRGDPGNVRLTRRGIAAIRHIERPTLLMVPLPHYRSAVSAPFEHDGYTVAPSDKGRFQQRSLELARGLRFLSWVLRQRESARLLALFTEYHLDGPAKPDYRRAVEYRDLEERLTTLLREGRKRVRRDLRNAAAAWLRDWTDALLERGLLVAGSVLACRECAHREWYRSDEIGQTFTCGRCAATSHVPATATRSLRLNEAFYQLRLHNGEVITYVLALLRDHAGRSLLYLPEVTLTHPQRRTGEADVAALVDGELVLAEAKSNDSIAKTEVDWYRYVAGRVQARRLIFATTARERPLCRVLDCITCAQRGGEHHRDYAWSDIARSRIQDTRDRLRGSGTAVETLCYRSLVASHRDAQQELAEVPG